MERRISLKDRFPLDAPITATGLNLVLNEEGAAIHTWARSHTSTSHDRIRLSEDRFHTTWDAAVASGLLEINSPGTTEVDEGLHATRIEVCWEEGERALEGWELRNLETFAQVISLLESVAPESMKRVVQAVEPMDEESEG